MNIHRNPCAPLWKIISSIFWRAIPLASLCYSKVSIMCMIVQKIQFWLSNELNPLWGKLRLQPMLQLALHFYLTIPQWKYGSYTPNAYILMYAFRCRRPNSSILLHNEAQSTGEFPSQRPVTRSFDIFFDLRLYKRLSKQSRRRLFETTIMTSL